MAQIRTTPSTADIDRTELLTHLRQLYADLLAVIQRDPEQEILGIALPVLDCVLTAAREHLEAAASTGGVAVTAAMVDLISPRTVHEAVPIRALDTWLVVGQVLAALGGEVWKGGDVSES